MIETEYEASGLEARYSTADLAELSLALFNGFGVDRLVDPDSVTDQTLDTTLAVLYDSFGVDDASESVAPGSESLPSAATPRQAK